MQFIKVNGHSIHYHYSRRSGKGKAVRTFFFLHSLGTDLRIWDEVAEQLKESGDILRMDLRGHGLSDVAPGSRGLEDFADDAEGLLKILGIQKLVIVGLSVGGMIAQILGTRIPSLIEAIVLCDTGYRIGNDQIWNERISQVKDPGLAFIAKGIMTRWFPESFFETQGAKAAGFSNLLVRTSVQGYIQAVEGIRDANLESVAGSIRLPVLCIVGSEDKSTTPQQVQELSGLIPGAKFSVIKGSAHLPCVDQPELLASRILEFLKS